MSNLTLSSVFPRTLNCMHVTHKEGGRAANSPFLWILRYVLQSHLLRKLIHLTMTPGNEDVPVPVVPIDMLAQTSDTVSLAGGIDEETEV